MRYSLGTCISFYEIGYGILSGKQPHVTAGLAALERE